MFTMFKRRALLQMLGSSALLLNLPVSSQAQTAFTTTALGNNLTLISGAGSNVVLAQGPDSVLLVNGGNQSSAAALLAEINRLSGNKPVSTLFNTNWRPEHSGLNYLLGPQGTTIIAHENTRLWQSTEINLEWQGADIEPMPKAAQANQTFYKTASLQFGSETVDYGFISQATTDGDIYVYFRQANVLVVGDMLGAGSYPLLDYVTGGWIGGMQKTTAGLLAMTNDTTKVLASNGGVLGKADIEAQVVMLDHAYAEVANAFKTGRSLEQFQEAAPMADFNTAWGDPALFLTLLYRSTWYRVPGRAVPGII